VIALLNARLYHGQSFSLTDPDSDVLPQLHHLSCKMREGAAERMQSLFPEGFIFTNALYGLAWTDLARYPSVGEAQRREALAEAEWALAQIESEKGRATFDKDLCPPYGVFYQGWRNLLRASIIRARSVSSQAQASSSGTQSLSPDAQLSLRQRNASLQDSAEQIEFQVDADSLVLCFQNQESPFLRSYHDGAWPADAFSAIASLAVYDQAAGPRYQEFIASWMRKTDFRRDAFTGLLPHSVNPENGTPRDGARGSSQALILRLMSEADPVRAGRDFKAFRNLFGASFLGLPGMAEYPHGKSGKGDGDSGPIPFGIGAASTIVSIGAARAVGDFAFARNLGGLVEAAGCPIAWAGRKSYGFGKLPIGEAFLCWSKSAMPGGEGSGVEGRNAGMSKKSGSVFWLFHLVSAALIAVLIAPMVVWRRR